VVILGLAIGLCLVMMIAHRSVSDEVATTLSSVGTTVTIGPPSYSLGGQPGKNLTIAELAPIARFDGVTSFNEILSSTAEPGGTMKNVAPSASVHTSLRPGDFNAAVYFSGSTRPTNPVSIGASTLRIVTGHAVSGSSAADVAMVSTAMAQTNGLKVGSTFTAYDKALTVAAIFDSDNQSGNDTVITSLPVLERLTDDTDQVDKAVVTVASLTELAAVTTAIENTLGPMASVTSNLANANQAIGDLNSVKRIALYSFAGAAGAAIGILLLVMVMIVRERKREIGILKAIGASNARIIAQFTTEAMTLTLFGSVVGFVVGIIAGAPVTSALVAHSGGSLVTDINARVSWGVVLEGLAAAAVVAILASAATTWMIGRIRPAEVLRSE
jgi:putative ABC transport system permease protein